MLMTDPVKLLKGEVPRQEGKSDFSWSRKTTSREGVL
jgi:hypothetical protein